MSDRLEQTLPAHEPFQPLVAPNNIHVGASTEWDSGHWHLLECASDWEDYKLLCDHERFGERRLFDYKDPDGPGKLQGHNHGHFLPDSYPCLVWSFNTFAAILQHRFVYPDDVTALNETSSVAPPPRRERASALAEGKA